MQDDPNQFDKFFTKFGMYILMIISAIIGKISNVLENREKPVTMISILAIAGISVFYGVLAGFFCRWRGYSDVFTSIIIGIVVFLSEKINNYINLNAKNIFDGFVELFFKIINRKNDGKGN